MKTTFFSFLTLSILVSSIATGQELPIGDAAPMTSLPMVGVDDKKHSLDELKGDNGLLVVFSCNTCPFVVGRGDKTEGWEGRYNGLAAQAESMGIGMVLVNSNEAKRDGDDSFDAMKNHADAAGYTMPYLVDNDAKLADAFGARTTPHVYLFNRNLKLAYRGSIDDNVNRATEVKKEYLQMAMKQMAADKKIKTQETKAVGCSIKRVK
jgi:peroxiredoxin